MLAHTLELIPVGSQTFSKSYQQYPLRLAPCFLSRGKGGRVWDEDDNGYVDLVCSLLAVTLGYCDPDVDGAIRDQLERGISFSLATRLETELAERLVDVIPSAEMVRYGKTGTDVTSAAVRLARAWTGRDRIGVCGYHGWQDWYIGATTRNLGIPDCVGELTHVLAYNDLEGVDQWMKQHKNEVAAIIMEPMNATEPKPGFLEGIKALTEDHGALLIFDEIVTGFRFSLGGAQEYFDVTPDLSCFGKGMANGMPLAAVVGRADIMSKMDDIFFSGTFGGEALSLAAAIAVIDKMRREPVIDTLWQIGEQLAIKTRLLIEKHGLSDWIRLEGKSVKMGLVFGDHETARKEAIRTVFIREMLSRGVLILNNHNVCYAHDQADLDWVVKSYDKCFATIADELARGSLEDRIGAPVIEPVFKVR